MSTVSFNLSEIDKPKTQPPPTPAVKPISFHLSEAKPISFKLSNAKPAEKPDNISGLTDNPDREGTYAVKVNGQVKQVPFSKVPHVAAIAPMQAIGSTNFANEADERRYLEDLEAADEQAKHEAYNNKDRWDLQAVPSQPATKPPDPVYEPTWWTMTKKTASGVGDIFFGASGPTAIPGMSTVLKGTDLDPQVMLQQQAANGDAQAIQTLRFQQHIEKTFGKALANVSGSQTFQKVFDPTSKNPFSRGVTGVTKSVEGMTSIENLYSLASIYAAPADIAAPMGLRFQGDLAASGVQGVAGATAATFSKDSKEGDAAEAWGNLLGNVAVIAAMHYAEHGTQTAVENFRQRDNTAILNDKAQDAYKKKFGDLTPEQKASVLYEAVEDANPRFKARVTQEVDRLNQKRKSVRIPVDQRAAQAGAEAAEPTTEEVRQQRLQAAKNLTRQIIERKAREEAYKQDALRRETAARQQQEAQATEYATRKAAEAKPSTEEQRGYGVVEGRTSENLPPGGIHWTTERESGQRYDPEHPEAGGVKQVERRATAGETAERTAQVTAAEARVQELTEQQMGQSFSSLPVYRQKVAAEWLERNHPEQWEAFKQTPAYDQHVVDVKHAERLDATLKPFLERNETGEQEQLAPGADLFAGTAKLIISRLNVENTLKADPATSKDLNEHTERFFGRSFDSLDHDRRISALAEYLRAKPAKLDAFVTTDIRQRMETGQHIDLANMAAENMARQRGELRMAQRDATRQTMDMDIAERLVTEERTDHQKEMTQALYDSLSGKKPSLEAIYRTSKGLTEQASKMGFGQVNTMEDLFKIERDAQSLPLRVRTPAVNEFLTRMRQMRVAAEDHILKALAEATAAKFREDAEGSREAAVKQIVHFSSQAADLQQAADDLRAQGQTQQANAAQAVADLNTRKADAVVAGVQSVENPAPPPQPKFAGKMSVGRETRAVSEGGVDLPAHFAVVEATDARTSHMPFTYETREGYDPNGQPRNYATSAHAQARVESIAAGPDPDKLLSNGVEATVGPPIVDHKLDVISGNRRTLGLLTALRKNPEGFGKYVAELHSRAAIFGIDPAEVLKFKNPLLVKVLDNPVESGIEWSRLGTEFNRGPEGGMNEEEQGEAMKRLLTPEFTDRLTGIVESLPSVDKDGRATSVREAMRARSSEIAQLLQDAGIISKGKIEEYVTDDGDLKEKAKDLFENMLTSLIVTNSDVLNRAPAEVKDRLGRAGLFFSKMQSAGENWNLASYNTDAVRLFTRAKDAQGRLSALQGKKDAEQKGATGGESNMERYLHPERFHDPAGANVELHFDDQPLVPPQHPVTEALAMALEESPRTYAAMMAKYANRAQGMQSTMWGSEHPADAFTNEIASKYGLKVIPEDWGAVTPLPEVVKAAIEDSRGPLPVEPAVHAETAIADVTPDPESVTQVIPEGPRTLQELRKVLETHPNLTPEQAEAATQYLENILPRALGVSAEELMGNRRLNFAVGGKEENYRGYMEMIDEATGVIRLLDSADISTFIHEVTHYIRKFMKPEFQKIANDFVGAKPGEEWTDAQEEMFSKANERYHVDGGIRRGKLEKVFAVLSRAMQSIYNQATSLKLAKGSPALTAMFDHWYDWTRAERKPITARIDVDELAEGAKGEWPTNLKSVDFSPREVSSNGQKFVFMDKEAADEFLGDKKNGVKAWRMYKEPGKDTIYMLAEAKKGKKLYQPSLNETIELAKKARELEAQLKREQDPRRQALLRGQLNGIEDKLRGATGIIGGKVEPKDTSAIQLVHGVSERPTMSEPTTPSQAVTAQQLFGDPTAVAIGGDRGKSGRVPDGPAGDGQAEVDRIPEQRGPADGESGAGKGKGTPIAKPDKNPLAGVKAAKLKAPEVPRGTPVVDPAKWREHVEALGLPTGTPPPTVRLDPDIRELAIYPGQAEVAEGVLSALQQYDATVLAAPLGSGKTFLNSVVANHLLGTSGDKVGLIVTRSQNLVHESDGYIDWGHRVGMTVEALPTTMAEVQSGGVYAGTYAQIRGNKGAFSVPWDFVIFDESAEARNWTESDQGRAVVMLGHAAKKVVYSSATPYSTIMEMGYMHKLGLWPKGGFAEWAGQFGLREVAPNTYSGGTSAKRLTKLRQQLIERGQWQTLHKDMDGVQGHVALIPQTEEVRAGVRSIRTAFAKAAAAFQKAGMSRYLTPTLGHEAIYLKRYIAGTKLPEAIELGKKLIADGWKPIFFTEYRSPEEEGMQFFHELPGGMGADINKMLPPLPDVVGKMREAFGDKVGIFAGEANQLRAGELEAFQGGDKDALYMTYGAGAVGANAQDKVGTDPRAAVFIDLPWGGMMFEQGTGRPWRYGSKSNVAMFFLTSDALPEMKLLATKILPRMRSLKAAVYGEKIESKLSKNLREAVGIPEEMLEYEEGEEVKPQAAEWEQDGEGASYTHIKDLELPKAKDAKNKGMKYKGAGRKLYQGPKDEDLDPWQSAARDAWKDLLTRTKEISAPAARAITANEGIIRLEAAKAGREAMGSGEPVKAATDRKMRDMENEALIWTEEFKDKLFLATGDAQDNARAASHFLKSSVWMFGTSGDRAVEKIFLDSKLPKEGAEIKRRMIDYDIRSGNYRGEFGGMIAKIIAENKLKPAEHETVTKIIEGKVQSDDPRLNKAAGEYRKFFATVRQRLADAGLAVVIYEGGKRKEVPFSKIEEDPNYWPRMYDWNEKFIVRSLEGKRERVSLSDIMNMPKGSERREKLIDKIAEQRGISKSQAQAFFDKNSRGIRLAGNIERAREFDIPMYGRDRQAIERYVNEVAEKLAAAEVHGQFRQKTDPLIDALPKERDRKLVNHIVTADLEPARLHDSDRFMLRQANRWLVISKMSLSALKLPFHLAKTSLATNTRSVARAILQGVTSPVEVRRNAIDCGAMTNYMRQAWMREYGMKTGGLDQKMLDFNGFTAMMYISRAVAAGAGRLWLEKYAYPELAKDPKNPMLRRKLTDLYGFTDDELDSLATKGYGPDTVKRVELGAANWTTGSGRPSELPPALRGTSGEPLYDRLTTLLRISQSLHGFMFKTANLVNRTVWQELYHADFKSPEPYRLIARFGANFGIAGWALSELLHLRHQMSGSSEAEIEKRRREWLAAHPMSKEALFTGMADISMGMGVEVLTQFFNELATHDPKDTQKLVQQNRVINAATDMFVGVAARDAYNAVKAVKDYQSTFYDTGPHKETPAERRTKIAEQLANEEVPLSRYAVTPHKVEPKHGRHRRVVSAM